MSQNNNHYCVVGYMHDFINEDELYDTLKSEVRGWNDHNRVMNSIGLEGINKEDYQASDFIDSRRGLMHTFKFCPSCGKKIDWKGIKKELKANVPK